MSLVFVLIFSMVLQAKEIALSFDDAPVGTTTFFETKSRTQELIKKLKALNVPSVLVFANPCKRADVASVLAQLKEYKKAGHIIGNHTCSHPRFDSVGFDAFVLDTMKASQMLAPLYSDKKYFRFPFLNEGFDQSQRDQMRTWLGQNNYKNGFVSIDTDDTILTSVLLKASKQGLKINHEELKPLFIKHVLSSAEFYNNLAIKQLGYSPKHVLLLHEIDGTVLYIDTLVAELRKQGWKIISAAEAYKDPLYSKSFKNTYTGNGLIAQLAFESSGVKPTNLYYNWKDLERDLNKALGLTD